MKNLAKKIVAGIIAATIVMAYSVPALADGPQVFVNFICDGQNTGKMVPVGSNVTAPQVPLHGGFTFCGFDKSLYNVRSNTTFTAIYVSNSLGDAAIAAKKASLPTPAVSPTTVADPNAAPAIPAVTPAAVTDAALLAQQNVAAAQSAVAAAQGAAQTPAATAPAATAPAATAPAAAAPAATAPAATAPAANAPAATTAPAQTPAVQTPAAAPAPAVTIPATVLPSWATPMNGVDLQGATEVYKYWKTVKNTDDATIQSNWGALLNHYAGHGTVGW